MFFYSEQSYLLAFLIGLLTCVAAIVCRHRYGKWLNPIAIISIWWGGWLAVAEINIIGISAPSYYTSSIVVTALISCFFGALTGRKYKTFHPVNISVTKINKRIANYVGVCLLVIAGPIFWFSYLGLSMQSTVANAAEYRTVALEGVGVYGSVFGYLFYNRLVLPLFFCCILWLQCRGFGETMKEKWLAVLVVFLVIAESTGTAGRTLMFYLVIGIVYCWIFRAHRQNTIIAGWNKAKVLMVSFPLIIWLIWMNQQRINTVGVGGLTISAYFAVWYHTAGFSLLDLELKDPFSRLNDFMTFGQASFGGLIEYVILILRPLVQYDSVAYLNGMYHSEFKLLGYSDMLSVPIFGNAYYTVLYSLFQDFSWFGIVGGGFLYGRFLNNSYCRYIHFGNFSSLYLLNALMYCGMFGLFQSPLESPRFWFAVFFAYFISRIESKHVGRP
jgi:oligosaccharide repeat unit polymerase